MLDEIVRGVATPGGITEQLVSVLEARGGLAAWDAGMDAVLRRATLADTLNIKGTWKLQAKVTLPSGMWLGETADLTVYAPFK